MSEKLFRLSDGDLRGISAAIQANRLAPPFTALSLQRLVPSSASQGAAADLQRLADLGFSNEQLVALLDLLLRDRGQRLQTDDLIDLVTTGPEVAGVTNRDTGVVVRQLFAQASTSVLVAGYAVYQGQRVFQALADRMEELPALTVQMFLDVPRPSGDATDEAELVRRFADRFRNHQWPKDRRLPEIYYDPRSLETKPGKRAIMHAKCVVVDRSAVFVSSANFTQAAQERNIEVGLLIRSGWLADRITWYFAALLSAGLLRPVF